MMVAHKIWEKNKKHSVCCRVTPCKQPKYWNIEMKLMSQKRSQKSNGNEDIQYLTKENAVSSWEDNWQNENVGFIPGYSEGTAKFLAAYTQFALLNRTFDFNVYRVIFFLLDDFLWFLSFIFGSRNIFPVILPLRLELCKFLFDRSQFSFPW